MDDEAPKQKPARHHEDERQRDFDPHQHAPHPLMRAAGNASAALFQSVANPDARELQGGRKPEQKGTQHRREQRVAQHVPSTAIICSRGVSAGP